MYGYGFIYKTILPSGFFHIGRKKHDKYDDKYFGGSKEIVAWFKRYDLNSQCCDPIEAGRIGVTRLILATAATEEELLRLEKKFIDDAKKADPFFL
jgi:hypothetical protein